MSESSEMSENSGAAASSEATRAFQARIADVWRNAVGGLAPTAEQVSRGVSRLARRLEVSPEEAVKVFGEFSRRVRRESDEFERRIEQGVRQALSGMGLVGTEEIADLEHRVDELIARVDKLASRRGNA